MKTSIRSSSNLRYLNIAVVEFNTRLAQSANEIHWNHPKHNEYETRRQGKKTYKPDTKWAIFHKDNNVSHS